MTRPSPGSLQLYSWRYLQLYICSGYNLSTSNRKPNPHCQTTAFHTYIQYITLHYFQNLNLNISRSRQMFESSPKSSVLYKHILRKLLVLFKNFAFKPMLRTNMSTDTALAFATNLLSKGWCWGGHHVDAHANKQVHLVLIFPLPGDKLLG